VRTDNYSQPKTSFGPVQSAAINSP